MGNEIETLRERCAAQAKRIDELEELCRYLRDPSRYEREINGHHEQCIHAICPQSYLPCDCADPAKPTGPRHV